MLAILLALAAHANDGTPASLHAAVQGAEQDVTLAVEVVESGEPGMSAVYDLQRDDRLLLDGHTFAAGEAIATETRCRGGPWSSCTDAPERCEDCDGDGTPECDLQDSWCEDVYTFEVLDECVPPGEQTWQLTALDWPWFESTRSLEVVDRGIECGDPPLDDDDPEDDRGCATVPVPAGLSGLLLGLVGLGALGSRRRRGR